MRMEEVAFSEWPGQPVDLDGGGNPWLPAYGCQTPAALLEREDFLGNPGSVGIVQVRNIRAAYIFCAPIECRHYKGPLNPSQDTRP
ncbi:unnamed protein product, partial [Callosobruchus maculatus]